MELTIVLPPALGHARATARAEMIEAAVARDLGVTARALVARSYAEIDVLAEHAELVWCPSAVCARWVSARAVFTIVRDGSDTYRSVIVARRDDDLTLSSLSGRRAAWVDRLSAGGYLLAAALLRSRGLDPERTFSSEVFAGSHRAALEAVLDGEADVTAVSTQGVGDAAVRATLQMHAGPRGAALAAIAVTEACPNDAIVVTTAADDGTAARLITWLTGSAIARSGARILPALEAERLVRRELGDYARALRGASPSMRADGPAGSSAPPARTARPPSRR